MRTDILSALTLPQANQAWEIDIAKVSGIIVEDNVPAPIGRGGGRPTTYGPAVKGLAVGQSALVPLSAVGSNCIGSLRSSVGTTARRAFGQGNYVTRIVRGEDPAVRVWRLA